MIIKIIVSCSLRCDAAQVKDPPESSGSTTSGPDLRVAEDAAAHPSRQQKSLRVQAAGPSQDDPAAIQLLQATTLFCSRPAEGVRTPQPQPFVRHL